MLKSVRARVILQGAAAFIVAAALKAFYSAMSVNDLRFLLVPTAWLSGLLAGETFVYEDYSGYVNADGSFVIAAPCAGGNFLIAAFAVVSVLWIWGRRASWAFLPASLVIAYAATIAANTVRITAALELHRMDPPMIWVNPEELHRIEGILIYFGFLLALFVVGETFRGPEKRSGGRLLAWSLLPLGLYWMTTLGVPLLNGASRKQAQFYEHAFYVLVTPSVLMLPLLIAWLIKRRSVKLALESPRRW